MGKEHFVSAEQEEAEARSAAADSGFQTFLKGFTIDTLPACPVGMRLLYEFGLSSTSLYGMAARGGFQMVPSPVERSPKWRAYAVHVEGCADCNEAGAEPIPYEDKQR